MATKNVSKATSAKSAVAYVAELKQMLDDVGELIERAARRGFRPSFVVSYGTIRSVSTSPMTARQDPRDRKAAPENECVDIEEV